MEEKPEIGLVDRMKTYLRSKPITPSDRVDAYITKKLPEFIDEYKLARRDDLEGIDKRIHEFVEQVDDLKEWKKNTSRRLDKAKKRVKRLERLEGMEDESDE